jgi:PTS system fructose-specific IIC component
MDGVSHMLPFVVGGGILIAIAFLIDTIYCSTQGIAYDSNFGLNAPAAYWFKNIGGLAFNFMLPILAGFIARSIADRPGLVVGFVGGWMANIGSTWGAPGGNDAGVSAGFLGALIAGFAAGYIVKGIQFICKPLPKSMDGIKPMLIYPVLGVGIIAVVMCTVNPVMIWINTIITNFLTWLGDSNLSIVLGILLGAMMAVDMGGPINKAAYLFGTGMLTAAATMTDASAQAMAYQSMASVMIGGMVPPIAIALATTFFPRKFSESERKSGPTNYIMGLCFITEGAIPYAAGDPLHVIPACVVGSGVAGGLSMLFKCTLMAPHGGIFVFATISTANNNPVVGILMYLVSLIVGSVVGMLMLALLKKNKYDVPKKAKKKA